MNRHEQQDQDEQEKKENQDEQEEQDEQEKLNKWMSLKRQYFLIQEYCDSKCQELMHAHCTLHTAHCTLHTAHVIALFQAHRRSLLPP